MKIFLLLFFLTSVIFTETVQSQPATQMFNSMLSQSKCATQNTLSILTNPEITNESTGAGSKTVTFQLAAPACENIDIDYTSIYSNTTDTVHTTGLTTRGTVSIPKGGTSTIVNYNITDNGLSELEKTVKINIEKAGNYKQKIVVGDEAVYENTIQDDEHTNTTITKVSAGDNHSCALDANGDVKCWGKNAYSQVGDGTTTDRSLAVKIDRGTNFSQIASSSNSASHICAIEQATNILKCWGTNGSYQLGDGTNTAKTAPITIDTEGYSSVSVSYTFSCGITALGVLKCWGARSLGQLGDGNSSGSTTTPAITDSGTSYSVISTGNALTCGITTTGVLKCWGLNNYGQVGDNTTVNKLTPTIIDSGTNYSTVSPSYNHTCGITTSGVLKCWGYRANGRLGDGATSGNILVPTVIDSGVSYLKVTTGYDFTCGITTANVLKCWGNNTNYQLGDGTTTQRTTPTVIDSGVSYALVSSGTNSTTGFTYACAVTLIASNLKCWGDNSFQQLGLVSNQNYTTPTLVDAVNTYSQISTGWNYTCGVNASNQIKCFGTFLDFTYPNNILLPIQIDSSVGQLSISSHGQHRCLIKQDNSLQCWGSNNRGQLGDGTNISKSVPVTIDTGVQYSQIATGLNASCGIVMTSGVLKCWGYNSVSLGNGTPSSTVPVVIDSGVSYLSIVVAPNSICGITTSNVLKCWGINTDGQLGDGTNTNRTIPTVIDSGVSYNFISMGANHTCGITSTNILKCWGKNLSYAVGDGTNVDRNTPIVIDGAETYSKVAAGGAAMNLSYGHTCAITTGGVLKCWGNNNNGQIGDNTLVNKTSPTIIDTGTLYNEIATGALTSCGVTTMNVLKCWGYNSNGQQGDGTLNYRATPGVVDQGVTYSKVSLSDVNSTSTMSANVCGLTTANIIKCWGSNFNGLLYLNSVLTNTYQQKTISKISSNNNHNCYITTDNILKCWGSNGNSQIGDGTSVQRIQPYNIDFGVLYATVSAGNAHTCGITTGGVLKCWGNRGSGKLGDGNANGNISIPIVIDAGVNYSMITTGNNHTCGITTSGQLKCWGGNNVGQLGDGTVVDKMAITNIDSSFTYSFISANGSTTCGITTAGVLKCWGYNAYGQVGDGTTVQKNSPVIIDSGVAYSKVFTNLNHTCGITTAGILKCWGYNSYGQVGDGTSLSKNSPVVIDNGNTYSDIAIGTYHTCGTTISGLMKCWGYNFYGQLGNGSTNFLNPFVIDSGVNYSSVIVGAYSVCGITTAGVLKCWGGNNVGQLGDGTNNMRNTPFVINSGFSFSEVTTAPDASNTQNSCAITVTGQLKCWGGNSYSNLGDGTSINRLKPVPIDSSTTYSHVAYGGLSGCGITTSDVLKCWGYNTYYGVGDGTTITRSTPVIIDSGTSYSKITSSSYSACGITTAGVLKCWGDRSSGRLGDGLTTGYITTPQIIDSGTTYAEISSRSSTTCGITTAGVLKCWGSNAYGQIGDGTTTPRTTPTVIDSGTSYSWASTSNSTTCGITTAGVLKCWGSNLQMQLGLGINTSKPRYVLKVHQVF